MTTLAEKYTGVRNGVMRSWRFQPTDRSAAMRAPAAMTAVIEPHATMPVMK